MVTIKIKNGKYSGGPVGYDIDGHIYIYENNKLIAKIRATKKGLSYDHCPVILKREKIKNKLNNPKTKKR